MGQRFSQERVVAHGDGPKPLSYGRNVCGDRSVQGCSLGHDTPQPNTVCALRVSADVSEGRSRFRTAATVSAVIFVYAGSFLLPRHGCGASTGASLSTSTRSRG